LAAGALQTWAGLTLDSCKYHPVYGTAGQTPFCINFAYHTPTWYSWYLTLTNKGPLWTNKALAASSSSFIVVKVVPLTSACSTCQREKV
jgi:hypothetical protein